MTSAALLTAGIICILPPVPNDHVQLLPSPLPAASLLLRQPALSMSFGDAWHLPELLAPANMMDICQQTQKLLSITLQSKLDPSNQDKISQGASWAWAASADPLRHLILSPAYHPVSMKFQQQSGLKDPGNGQHFQHHQFAVLSHCIFHSTAWTCHILELFAKETNSFIYYLSLVIFTYSIYYIIDIFVLYIINN